MEYYNGVSYAFQHTDLLAIDRFSIENIVLLHTHIIQNTKMAENSKSTAFINALNAPSVTIEALRHLLVLQNVSVQLQKELLIQGGMAADKAEDLIISLMTRINDSVHEQLVEWLNKAQKDVDRQTGL